MAFLMLEFLCPNEHRTEFLAQGEEEIRLQEFPCEECGERAERAVSAPALRVINRGNADYYERQKPRMKERSREHWNRTGKADAVDREREQLKKYIAPA